MRKRQFKYNSGEIGNIDQFLDDNIRQVRWLYNNSNKCLMVVCEKDVRLIVSKLKAEINDLQNKNT